MIAPSGSSSPLLRATRILPAAIVPVDMSWISGSWPGRGTPSAIGLTERRRSEPPDGATWMPKPVVLTKCSEGETGGSCLLGPGADPAHVAAVAHADHRHAVRAGAPDAELDRLLGDHLAEPLAAVDHHDRAGVRHDLGMPLAAHLPERSSSM